MEIIGPADWGQAVGISPSGQAFVQRWLELLHRLTIDTYRVRHLNLRLAFLELRAVTREVTEIGTDIANVKEVAAEALRLLKEDPLASETLPQREHYYGLLAQSVTDKREMTPGLAVLVEQACAVLQEKYRPALLLRLREAITDNDVDRAVTFAGLLATDLVGDGYDIRHLYARARRIIDGPQKPFEEKLATFLQRFQAHQPQEHTVTVRLIFKYADEATQAPAQMGAIAFTSDVPGAVTRAVVDFARVDPRIRYARTSVRAPDQFSAVRLGVSEISKALDLWQFSKPRISVDASNTVIVRRHDGREFLLPLSQELLGPIRIAEEELGNRLVQINAIEAAPEITPATKQRLGIGLQYLRRGVTDPTSHGQFLNLWIGLETVIGGLGKTVLSDLRRNASRLIALGYPRRVVDDLKENIRRLHINLGPDLNASVLDEASTTAAIVSLCNTLYDPVTRATVLGAAASSVLLQTRISSVSDLLTSRERILRALRRTEEDVTWHLQRMFRIRNSIVHGGDVPKDLTHINSHLATYLWATLRVSIQELAKPSPLRSLEAVFEKFSWLYNEQVRVLGTEPAAKPPFDDLVQPHRLWPN